MFFLNINNISSEEELIWAAFLDFAFDALNLDTNLVLSSQVPIIDDQSLVYVSSSQALSRKLVSSYSNPIYIQPRQLPFLVDHCIYYHLLASPNFFTELNKKCADQLGTTATFIVENWSQQLRPAEPKVTLISSVFNGDKYLSGFLENMAELEHYDDVEHLLIRPGSSGKEHDQLVAHVQQHPGAVYINMEKDPGLYQVWNLGSRLASAPYLSNANIDDRRASDQLSRLFKCLDEYPEVAAVSAGLRVTEKANLSWGESTDCPVWFKDASEGVYPADQLIKKTESGYRSCNLLHCMPLWRRYLHADYGEFAEKRFGPSADWEFWLRCGTQGEKFYFLPRPLGLYLKDPGSYWRRSEDTEKYDSIILNRYQHLCKGKSDFYREPVPPAAQRIDYTLSLLQGQAYGSGLLQLLRLVKFDWGKGKAIDELLSNLSRRYLTTGAPDKLLSNVDWDGYILGFFEVMVGVVHILASEKLRENSADSLARILSYCCLDWYEMSSDRRWLMLWAFISRLSGQDALERQLLNDLHAHDPVWFWQSLQALYRFTVPLAELGRVVGGVNCISENKKIRQKKIQIYYFPAYQSGNTYMQMLYRSVTKNEGITEGINSFADLATITPLQERQNILHLHWVHALFKDLSRNDLNGQADRFFTLLHRLKQSGFIVYWTIHNNLSHECVDIEFETGFRRKLAQQVDRIYVHHPMIVKKLEWLEESQKIHLVEHGGYETTNAVKNSSGATRGSIGLKEESFIITHIGRIRKYKALKQFLPVLLRKLAEDNGMELVVAGKVMDEALGEWLESQQQSGFILCDQQLSQLELERFMVAADFGFLSYSDILTSGTLFHWFSCGKPVIAPSRGTIPAYVVEGWNGFLYNDTDELSVAVDKAKSMSASKIKEMGNNALDVAKRLRWEFF